eukprot:761209-Hanusia_phi.AAC.1
MVSSYTLTFTPVSIAACSNRSFAWALSSTSLYVLRISGSSVDEFKVDASYQGSPLTFSTPLALMLSGSQTSALVAQADGSVYYVDAVGLQALLVHQFSSVTGFGSDPSKDFLATYRTSGSTVYYELLSAGFCSLCPPGFVSQPNSSTISDCYLPTCMSQTSYPVSLETYSVAPVAPSTTYMFYYKQCLCKPGFVGNGSVCVACPANTYSDGNTLTSASISYCSVCPVGTYSPAQSSGINSCIAATCRVIPFSVPSLSLFVDAYTGKTYRSCTCITGYVGDPDAGKACQPCPAGSYKDVNSSTCKPCASHSASTAASLSCFCNPNYVPYPAVPDGYTGNYPVVYSGQVRGGGADRCALRSDVVLGNYYVCDEVCVALTFPNCTGVNEYPPYLGSVSCNCMDGYVKRNGVCVFEPVVCPDGYQTIQLNSSYSICQCPDNTSTYVRNQSCTAGLTIQNPCPRALVVGPGFGNVDQCRCDYGYIAVNGSCEPCPAGTFQVGNVCQDCGANEWSHNASTRCYCYLGHERINGACI